MGHKNTKKHKAQHGGYSQKPSKRAINALLDLYAGVSELPEIIKPRMEKPGTQLSLF
jgi:hypothetical protein